jgi:hypothetical protein
MYTGTIKAAQITDTLLPLFSKFEESIELIFEDAKRRNVLL